MQTFWAIVASNALWVVILALGVALLSRVWKNPLCLHLLWMLVLLKLVTPPLLTIPLPLQSTQAAVASIQPVMHPPAEQPSRDVIRRQEQHEAAAVIAAAVREAPPRAKDQPAIESPVSDVGVAPAVAQHREIPWLLILGWLWAVGVVLLASRHAYRIIRFRNLLRSSEPPSPALLDMAARIAKSLGLSRAPEIRMLPVRMSPLVWSLCGRPQVFLPAEFFAWLDQDAQESILAHELAHVRRKDHWVRLFELAITTLFWWHPVVWWAARQLQELEDQCCDGVVVDLAPHAAKHYATALLNTLDFLSDRSTAAPLGTTATKSSVFLARRIAMLKNRSWNVRLTSGRLILVLAMAALPMALAFGVEPANEKAPASPDAAKNDGGPSNTAESAEQLTVVRRSVNKLVKDFPEKVDLSTPESVVVAFCRNMAKKDVIGAQNVCWAKLDPQIAKEVEEAMKHDPGAPKDEELQQACRDTEILEVLTYRDDFAFVVCKEGKGARPGAGPFCGVSLGKINGMWRILSMDSGPVIAIQPSQTIQAVVDEFQDKKEVLWNQFAAIRKEVLNGRTPIFHALKCENKAQPKLSAAEKEAEERLLRKCWQLNITLDAPGMHPPAVQLAILDEDPSPDYTTQVARMQRYNRRELEKADNKDRKEQLRNVQMRVSWDFGFREIMADKLHLLADMSSMSGGVGGKKWIVTKVAYLKGKPVCWCIPVELTIGKKTEITLNEQNAFDLRTVYDKAMQGPPAAIDQTTWTISYELDMPDLQPQAVQCAIFDEDPAPAFIAHVKRMRAFAREQLEKARSDVAKEQVNTSQMDVGWNLGFRKVTADTLYLLTNTSHASTRSNGPDGKKWIVTKIVHIKGKPVCWCIPIEVEKGEEVDVTLDQKSVFDLRAVYDRAMAEESADAGEKTP